MILLRKFLASQHDDVGPGIEQRPGGALADSAPSSADDGGTSGEIEGMGIHGGILP